MKNLNVILPWTFVAFLGFPLQSCLPRAWNEGAPRAAESKSESIQPSPEAKELLEKGIAAFHADFLDDAVVHFASLTAKYPKWEQPQTYLARALVLKKDFRGALEVLRAQKGIQNHSKEADFLYQMYADAIELWDHKQAANEIVDTDAHEIAQRVSDTHRAASQRLVEVKGVPNSKRTCVVVLGAALTSAAEPAERLLSRLEKTKQIAAQLPEATYVMSGKGKQATTEAEAMEKWLVANKAKPMRLVLEKQSMDTLENAEFGLNQCRLAGAAYVLLVTDEAHIQRASVIFKETSRLKFNNEFQQIDVASPLIKQGSENENRQGADFAEYMAAFRDAARVHGVWLKPGFLH